MCLFLYVFSSIIVLFVGMSSLSSSDLDISWIEESERIQNLQENPVKENCEELSVRHVFVNLQGVVVDVVHDSHSLVEKNTIDRDTLMQWSHAQKRKTQATRYVMKDLLLYHVDLDPEQVPLFVQNEDVSVFSKGFMKRFDLLETVDIPPSIFVFHPLQILYCFYFEEELVAEKEQLKSILRSEGGGGSVAGGNRHKITKRVKIKMPRSTRKQRE